MPRLVAVVGGKHSGKTTVVEHLTAELKRRGYRVGVIKEMVRIPTLDTPATETDRYSSSGAEIVVAVPRNETVLFIKRRLSIDDVLPFLQGLDYVVLEGFEAEKTLPKIIAAKNTEEAASFSDGLAIAMSGLIAESAAEVTKASQLQIPIFKSNSEAAKLADIVERKAFAKLPDLPHCGECGYESCYEMAKAIVKGDSEAKNCLLALREDDVTVEVNGVRLPLKEFPRKIIKKMVEEMISSLSGIPEVKELKIELKKE